MTICAGSEETDSCEVRFFSYNLKTKSLYGTEIVIWDGFGSVGSGDKKIDPILSNS